MFCQQNQKLIQKIKDGEKELKQLGLNKQSNG
jgi:hypothetical protein